MSGEAYHGHDLADCRVGDAELVDDGGQHEGDAPAADAVRDPDHEEGDEGGVS